MSLEYKDEDGHFFLLERLIIFRHKIQKKISSMMISYFLEKSINHITQKKRKQQNIFDDSLGFPANTLRILKCSPPSFQNVRILYHPNVPNICTEWRHHFLINKKTFFAEILTNYKSSRRRCFCQKYLFFWPKINCGMRMSHLWNKPFITLSRHERFYIFSLSILVISVFIIPMAL